MARGFAIQLLGSGLSAAKHHEDALSVKEARLSLMRRLGASVEDVFIAQGNLANSYQFLGRLEEAMSLRRDVYSGCLKLNGEVHEETLRAANNYSLYENPGATLDDLREAVTTLEDAERTMRRVFGGAHPTTVDIGECLQESRATLRARETPASSA